jgi:hypothetical protein
VFEGRLTILDTPNYLEVIWVNAIGRAAENNFTVTFNDDEDKVRIDLDPPDWNTPLPIGEGPILEVLYDVNYYAQPGEVNLDLDMYRSRLRDYEGTEINFDAGGGIFQVI